MGLFFDFSPTPTPPSRRKFAIRELDALRRQAEPRVRKGQ